MSLVLRQPLTVCIPNAHLKTAGRETVSFDAFGDAPPRRKASGDMFRKPFEKLTLEQLTLVNTLGKGAHGCVQLVQLNKRNSDKCYYALKVMNIKHIIDAKQEYHVQNERAVLFACSSNFIIKLYKTFKDENSLYMLSESCMGGELWSALRERDCFNDSTARFYAACVVEAFDYLHRRGIIYRDLKPENMILDSRGYAKMADFGFAKRIGLSSKTYTFCGTPEYIPPEMVLQKGHDRAMDLWSLGILIYEMLCGVPPFTSNDKVRTFNRILVGFEEYEFHSHMSHASIDVIKILCHDFDCQRLGYETGKMEDVRCHDWFYGFDFESLRNRTMKAPIKPTVETHIQRNNRNNPSVCGEFSDECEDF